MSSKVPSDALSQLILTEIAAATEGTSMTFLLDGAVVVGYPAPRSEGAKQASDRIDEVWAALVAKIKSELGPGLQAELLIPVHDAQVIMPTLQSAPVVNAQILYLRPSAIRGVSFGQTTVTRSR